MTTIEAKYTQRVHAALHTAASWGLPSSEVAPEPADSEPLQIYEAYDLASLAVTHRLLGLVDQAVAEDAVRCTEEAAAHLRDRALGAASWSLVAERHLLAVHELFDQVALPHRFLKGAAVAHRFYDHPGLRMFVDIDVLVPQERIEEAVDVLDAAGHERDQPDPYRGFSRRWAKSVATVHQASRVEVDLHRVIADGPFGLRSDPGPLWERPAADVVLGDTAVPALDPVAAFVQACANTTASYDLVSFGSLRDVAELARVIADEAAAVAELAGVLGLQACVADAVARVRRELAWGPPPSVAEMSRWKLTAVERAWLDSYRNTSDVRRAVLGLRAVPSAGAKVRYAGSVARLLAGRPARRRALEECDPCRKMRIQ